jgi:hypothetical protein
MVSWLHYCGPEARQDLTGAGGRGDCSHTSWWPQKSPDAARARSGPCEEVR